MRESVIKLELGFSGGSDVKETACNAGDGVQSLDWENSLEEGMATHSSTLAWRTPWTGEPGRLQFMGQQGLDMTQQLTHHISIGKVYAVNLMLTLW